MNPLQPSTPVVRTSLADQVYDRLLEGILSGAKPSGAELVVSDLARDFAVSPSPVREALLRLAAHGLVHSANNRRATVVSFSRDEIVDLFEVRELLEAGAARLAAQRIDDASIAALRLTSAACGDLFGQVERKKEMLDLDNRLHLQIAAASGNQLLRAEILEYSRRIRVIQWLRLAPANMRNAYDEHQQLIDAVASRRPEAAAQAMSHHIRTALELVLEGLGRPTR